MNEKNYKLNVGTTGLLIHADNLEDSTKEQIDNIANHPAMKDLIAIMPDAHAGEGCVIGFTGKFKNAVIPNIVGVDIGCGVVCYPLGKKEIDFVKLDEYIRKNIPLGFKCHSYDSYHSFEDVMQKTITPFDYYNLLKVSEFYSKYDVRVSSAPYNQLGTLGGGNHFIEVDKDENGERYLIVHSGSRNLGLKIATYFQKKAKEICSEMNINIPTGLEYLPLSCGGKDYLDWMRLAQEYAKINREIMIRIILSHLGVEFNKDKYVESIHNYIASDNIIRKGAIQAYKNQSVIVPLNMADGTIIGIGKGNSRYNFSAPHGAGRVHGRKEMQRMLKDGRVSMDEFKKSMDGIYSTSIKESTIDESKFAYKPKEDIIKYLEETIEIKKILKPVYNLKSDDEID